VTPPLGPAKARPSSPPSGEANGPATRPTSLQRLTQPLVRDGGSLRPASWDEALARAAAGFDAARALGPNGFGMFSCSKASNEMNFIAQKFTRTVMGSNNVDSCNRT
jgi:formate dehydrogenase (hydrogenase)